MKTLDVAPQLLLMGYSPVPISDYQGRPALRGWDSLRVKPMDAEALQRHAAMHPFDGLAVAGGYKGLVPIDIDTDDLGIWQAVSRSLPKPVVARRGSKGFVAFYRDPTGLIADMPRKNFCDAAGKVLIEVKVNGTATIPPSLHRRTRKPYTWVRITEEALTVCTLFNTPVDELSVITVKHLEKMARNLERWCPLPTAWAPRTDLQTSPVRTGRMHAWAEKCLANAQNKLSATTEGRNGRLCATARALGKYVHHRVLDRFRVEEILLDACKRNGSLKQHGLEQCKRTIASGLKRAKGDDLPALPDRPRDRKSV
jgi:bifunctional DNA primase/polymerase-like protein